MASDAPPAVTRRCPRCGGPPPVDVLLRRQGCAPLPGLEMNVYEELL